MTGSTLVLIIGMHRSGTSLCGSILKGLGLPFPGQKIKGDISKNISNRYRFLLFLQTIYLNTYLFTKSVEISPLINKKDHIAVTDYSYTYDLSIIMFLTYALNSISYIFASAVNYNIQICLFKNYRSHICLNCLFPNDEDVEIARCETIGISSICAGMAGLITAQKTINAILEITEENNILSLINTENLSISNIKSSLTSNCHRS